MTSFQDARSFLLANRTDYDKAVAEFRWPDAVDFNWALDWFDAGLAQSADSKDRTALWIVDAASGSEIKLSFETLSRRSNQVANYLRARGLKRGDHLLLLLGNVVPLWETMLAAMKLGLVIIPATTRPTARGSAMRPLTVLRRPLRPTARRAPTIRCCCTSLPGPPRNRSWCCTASAAIRSADCQRCTGSACSRAMSISTSRRRVGPNTPGAASSRRGMQAQRYSWSTSRGSMPRACCRWSSAAK